MRRHELEHILRAAGSIAGVRSFYVVGSQAILASTATPSVILDQSVEADIWPADDPEKADLIDGTIGEMSPFHDTFGYYAHGVGPETAVLPAGWKSRVVALCNENTNGVTGLCLHPVDLAIAKLAAGRDKDLAFVSEMLKSKLVAAEDIIRTAQECSSEVAASVSARISSLDGEPPPTRANLKD